MVGTFLENSVNIKSLQKIVFAHKSALLSSDHYKQVSHRHGYLRGIWESGKKHDSPSLCEAARKIASHVVSLVTTHSTKSTPQIPRLPPCGEWPYWTRLHCMRELRWTLELSLCPVWCLQVHPPGDDNSYPPEWGRKTQHALQCSVDGPDLQPQLLHVACVPTTWAPPGPPYSLLCLLPQTSSQASGSLNSFPSCFPLWVHTCFCTIMWVASWLQAQVLGLNLSSAVYLL